MGKIRLLPEEVASQVAAGEVVERPASILKELVENSLDAGATRVEITWQGAGSRLLSVSDNGCGMERDDALLALERHATSKIATASDLAGVATFGFRGEALPSIASVTRFRLRTRTAEASDPGTEIVVEGGRLMDVRDCGGPPGTEIQARALFFNLPARKKFLRSDLTETAHLLTQFYTLAIAHPGVAFILRKENRPPLRLPPTTSLLQRLVELFGQSWVRNLFEAGPVTFGSVTVSGILSGPGTVFPDRSGMFFYLNKRPVSDGAILRGLRAALGAAAQRGHPRAILFLEMPPGTFDCNVHPAKREVRFQRPDDVAAAVEAFCREVFASATKSLRPGASVPPPSAPAKQKRSGQVEVMAQAVGDLGSARLSGTGLGAPEPPEHPELPLQAGAHGNFPGGAARQGPQPEPSSPLRQVTSEGSEDEVITPAHEKAPDGDVAGKWPGEDFCAGGTGDRAYSTPGEMLSAPRWKFIGSLGNGYFLWQSEEGLVVMEARHALERVVYEGLVRQLGLGSERMEISGSTPSCLPAQHLLTPEVFQPAPRVTAWLLENTDLLRTLGFWIEPFGTDAIKIEAVPAGFDDRCASELLGVLAEAARSGRKSSVRRTLQDELCLALASARARAKVPGGDEAPALLRELFRCELPYLSPSGRPTLLLMSWRELERKFRPERFWGE